MRIPSNARATRSPDQELAGAEGCAAGPAAVRASCHAPSSSSRSLEHLGVPVRAPGEGRTRLRVGAPARVWGRAGAWALVVASLLCSAARVRAEEPTLDEVVSDPKAVPPEGTSSRLVWTGVGLAAGWYAVNLGASLLWQDAPASSDWRIPVAGPWMALGDVRCGEPETSCGDFLLTARTAITLIASVGQVGGLFAIAEGLFLKTPANGAPAAQAREPRWMAMPVALPGGAAVHLVGEF